MLKINKKLKYPLLGTCVLVGGFFLYRHLTFIPEYSSATEISTTDPISLPAIEGEITTKFGTEAQGYKTYMQEISLSYCQSLPDKTTGQLADGRDGKIYWVTVLGTGSIKTCWMTQDLDYDLNGQILTTKNDGDNLLQGSDGEWSGRNNDGSVAASSSSGWTTTVFNAINWWNRNDGEYANGVHQSSYNYLGNLYSWQAVTANMPPAYGGTANNSICPAGWKLPLGGDNSTLGSFSNLGVAEDNITQKPFFFQKGGRINGSLGRVGTGGYYWSATPLDDYNAYDLYFNDSSISLSDYSDRCLGMSVRCVVRDVTYIPPVIPSRTATTDPDISVTVPNIITLDVSNSVDIATESNKINTGEFTATVSSNKDYTISLNATSDNTDATSLVNHKDGNKVGEIKTIGGNEQPEAGISGWGIRTCAGLETESCVGNYFSLPGKGETNTFAAGTKGSNTHLFQIGIGIGSELPSGTYSTSIQVTAAQK